MKHTFNRNGCLIAYQHSTQMAKALAKKVIILQSFHKTMNITILKMNVENAFFTWQHRNTLPDRKSNGKHLSKP
jgi:hypothetical protein